jgi:hypothetical protein
MIDTFEQSAATLPGEPDGPYYRTCARDAVYGISVGWGDEYQSTLADQWIVINGVDDGDYCLVSTADPAGHILESNDNNNAGRAAIHIAGNTVTPLGSTATCGS